MQTVYYVAGSIAALGTLVAAIIAVCVYRRNSRLEQSRWASSFYEKYYEADRYKVIREALDSDDNNQIRQLVEKEEAEFTDYLSISLSTSPSLLNQNSSIKMTLKPHSLIISIVCLS